MGNRVGSGQHGRLGRGDLRSRSCEAGSRGAGRGFRLVRVLVCIAGSPARRGAVRSALRVGHRAHHRLSAQAKAHSKGLAFSTTVVLADGLAGVREELVRQIVAQTRALHQVVGGAAGDEGRFKATLVGNGAEAASDMAAAAHVFGAAPWGVGIGRPRGDDRQDGGDSRQGERGLRARWASRLRGLQGARQEARTRTEPVRGRRLPDRERARRDAGRIAWRARERRSRSGPTAR